LLPANLVNNHRYFYLLQCTLAWFRFYKGIDLLAEMMAGDILKLVREPENNYDIFVISLF